MKSSKHLYKYLALSIGLLMLCIIFSDLLHSIFSWVFVKPVASTITSGIWTDVSFLVLGLLVGIALIKVNFKQFGSIYIIQAFIIVTSLLYLFHRIEGSRYHFEAFSFAPDLNYADLILLLAVVYLALQHWGTSRPEQDNVEEKSRPAQRVIKNYLVQRTNYALLINGKRGTGKTYFMKHIIQPMIHRTLIEKQDSETYKTIFISLFGVEKIDEIYFQLAINIKPYLKHLTIQSDSVLAGILTRGMMNLSGAGSIEDYISDIKSVSRKQIGASNFVLIFDDLDRMSDKLSVNEFIGFVNSMVEHENNKVLIIADELQIEQKELYNAAKEKSIGVVVDFRAEFKDSVSEIITDRYRDGDEFLRALKDTVEDILKVFKDWKCENLRTFIYFLNHYQEIVRHIDSQHHTAEVLLLQLKDAADYCALFCIEFSKGLISFSNPAGVNEPGRVNSFLSQRVQIEMFKMMRKRTEQQKTGDEPAAKEVPYIEIFSQQFNKKGYYYFYKSIFDLVTGGDQLNTVLLDQELKENVTDRIFKPTEEELVYQKLAYPVVYDLSNEEYIDLSEKMRKFALDGKYPLPRYNEIFHRLNRFPGIKAWPEKQLSDELIEAMHRNKDCYAHDRHESLHRRHTDRSQYSAYEKAIDEAITEVNNSLGLRDSMFRRQNLFSVFSDDPDKFYEACNDDYVQKPVFNTWDFAGFFEVFQGMKASDVINFNNFIRSRYGNIEGTGWVEYDFLSALYNKLAIIPENNPPYTLRKSTYDDLSLILDEIVKRYYELNPT